MIILRVSLVFAKIVKCLDRHAPLWHTKLTRPPAPWLHEPNKISLQKKRKIERREAQKRPSKEGAWNIFRDTWNKLKKVIRKAKKRTFMMKALSSKRPMEVWKTIHCIY